MTNLLTEEEAVGKVTSAPTYATGATSRRSTISTLDSEGGDGTSISSTPGKASHSSHRLSDVGSGSVSGSGRKTSLVHGKGSRPMERIAEEMEKESLDGSDDMDERDVEESETEPEERYLLLGYLVMRDRYLTGDAGCRAVSVQAGKRKARR